MVGRISVSIAFDGWLESHKGTFSLIPPRAAAIAFPRYHLDINSTELVERLIHEKSVFIVPRDHFSLDHTTCGSVSACRPTTSRRGWIAFTS